MTGKELLEQAAALGPTEGLEFLAKTFTKHPYPLVGEFMAAIGEYRDPETGELRDDTPEPIRALANAAHNSLMGA